MANSSGGTYSFLITLLKLGSVLIVVLTFTGYLGEINLVFELTSHFRLQYLLVAVAMAALFLWIESKSWAALSLLALTINAAEILPVYANAGPTTRDHNSGEFTVLLSNVLKTNTGYSRLIELVEQKQPDMFIALECDKRWIEGLSALAKRYPHQKLVPREDNFGIALYSRLPLETVDVIELGDSGVPSISTKIRLSNKVLSVLATHPPPPIGQRNYSWRNQQLSAIASYIQNLSGPRIIIGDLNVSLWSPYFERLIERSGLLNARRGHGLIPSWPTFLPFLMIPIDHCLVSPDVSVDDIDSGPDIGSDHLPIFVKIQI